MRTVIAALAFVSVLMAQRGGFGHGSMGGGGGYRGAGTVGGYHAPATSPGFRGGFGGGAVVVRPGTGYGAYGVGHVPVYRYYGGGYRYYGYGPSFGIGFGWPGYYNYGYYGSPYGSAYIGYGAAYDYPYASSPSVTVITTPSQSE